MNELSECNDPATDGVSKINKPENSINSSISENHILRENLENTSPYSLDNLLNQNLNLECNISKSLNSNQSNLNKLFADSSKSISKF